MRRFFPRDPADIISWTAVLAGSFVASLIPLVFFRVTTGAWIPSIMPQLSADAFYYLKQIREVLDGHPFLGNPFIREYADAHFPGLVLPMWIGAVPGFFGLSINGVFIFNAIFYNLLTGALLYLLLLRLTKGSRWLAVATALIGVVSLHNFLIRPLLQIVYPALIAFLLALFIVLEHPRNKHGYVWLGGLAVFAFYLYPHLWMPEFAVLGLLFLRLLWFRDKMAICNFLLMGIGIGVACIPEILTIVSLFSDPMSRLINLRSGLVETHRVLPLTVLNLKYLFLLFLGLGVLRMRHLWTSAEWMLLLIAGGILCAAFSNVITGKEMDLDTHPLWMAFLINVIAIGVFAHTLQGKASKKNTAVASLLLLAFLFTTAARTARNAFPYLLNQNPATASLQEDAAVFSYLQTAKIHQSVLLAPSAIGGEIPLYTDSYPLFSSWAALHVIPSEELLDRFLTQNIDHITANFLAEHVSEFTGEGLDRTVVYRNVYGGNVQPIDLIDPALLPAALARARIINARYESFLRTYHVQFAITDRKAADNPRIPADAMVLWKNERFTVYGIGDGVTALL